MNEINHIFERWILMKESNIIPVGENQLLAIEISVEVVIIELF